MVCFPVAGPWYERWYDDSDYPKGWLSALSGRKSNWYSFLLAASHIGGKRINAL